jgi:hypothetical protein
MSDLTAEYRRLAEDAACRIQPLTADDAIRQGDRWRRRSIQRRSLAVLSSAGLAVAAVILALTAMAPGRPVRPQPQAHLVAWTVARLSDGNIRVRIFQLRDPAGLQAKLRAEGVPASVVTGPPGACQRYPASRALLNRVFPGSYRLRPPPGKVIVIHLRALPGGTGVQLAGLFRPTYGYVAAPVLVHASHACTGS